MIDSIVGQPALVTALREVMTAPEQGLHLLVAGPHGTGRSLTVEVLTRILASRGFDPTPVQLAPEQVVRLDEAAAVTHVRDRVEGCVGERLLVVDALDELVSDDYVGPAVADELHRLISIYTTELQIIAFAAPDGYRKLVDVSPALAAWWRVVRTRDLDAADYATIFGRVVEQRGATTSETAARRAGDMLAATPAEGRLRNARLATYLAEMAVEAARRRTDGSGLPMVDVPDLPQLETDPDQTEASGALPPGSFSRLDRTR